MPKIETQRPWNRIHTVYLEEMIARFDRDERETLDDDDARMVYAVCKQALIEQRRPAVVDVDDTRGHVAINGFRLTPAVLRTDGVIELGPHVARAASRLHECRTCGKIDGCTCVGGRQ